MVEKQNRNLKMPQNNKSIQCDLTKEIKYKNVISTNTRLKLTVLVKIPPKAKLSFKN